MEQKHLESLKELNIADLPKDQEKRLRDLEKASRRVVEEIAREVGVNLKDYNPDLSARDAGKIGGRIGGKKGGGITRDLIAAGKRALENRDS